MPAAVIDTPVGRVQVVERDGALVRLTWVSAPPSRPATPLLVEAARQLGEYFAGTRRDFDLRLEPAGSEFHRRAWAAMREIPYGGLATYAGLAMQLGSGPRTVGGACKANPLAILIPCHRVVASGGRIGGYSGGEGLPTKRKLLALERPDFALS